MPGAGGGTLSLRPLCLALGSGQPFYGLQAVGFDGKVPPLETIEDSAMVNIAAIKSIQPQGPYTLLGYSNGGVVAYEMARMLLESGEKVASLMLLESLCPLVRVTDPIEEITIVCNSVLRSLGSDNLLDVDVLKRMPEDKRREHLFEVMSGGGLQMTEDQFLTSYNVSTTSDRSCRIYNPVPLDKEIDACLFRGIDGYPDMPEDYGWNMLLPKPIRVHNVQATHFNIIEKGPVQEVAEKIKTLGR